MENAVLAFTLESFALWNHYFITNRNSSCGKVMFSRAFISHSVHGGGWVGMSGPRSPGGWVGGYTSGGRYTRGWVYQREVGIGGGRVRIHNHTLWHGTWAHLASRWYASYWNAFLFRLLSNGKELFLSISLTSQRVILPFILFWPVPIFKSPNWLQLEWGN